VFISLGNRKKASPAYVDLKIPSRGQRRRVLHLVKQMEGPGGQDKADLGSSLQMKEEAIVLGFAESKPCHHLFADNGDPIVTVEDFIEHAENEFVEEAWKIILSPESLDAMEKKLSELLPDSSSSNPPNSSETVSNVSKTTSMKAEDVPQETKPSV